jgi:DNA-binding transcriptional LysR family regulator
MVANSSDRFVRTHLKTRHLVLLVELGRHRSIAHAAKAANLSQPAASKLLAELEYALGVPLFERMVRGIAPTWYGEVMIRRAGAALSEMDAGHQEVMELLSGLSGRVSVGTVMAPSASLVPEAITLVKSRHKRLQVSITVDTSKVLLQQLRSGAIDIMIGRVLDTEIADDVTFEPITDEPHSLVARAGHPLAKRDDIQLTDLANQAWIMPPAGSIMRDRLTAMFLSQAIDLPAEIVETMSVPVITALLTGSDMIVALPLEMVKPHLDFKMLTVLPFDLNVRMDVYGIVTRRKHRLSPGAQAVLETLREVAAARVPKAAATAAKR